MDEVLDLITARRPKIIKNTDEITSITHQLLYSARPVIPAPVALYAAEFAVCVLCRVANNVMTSAKAKTAIPKEITAPGIASNPNAPFFRPNGRSFIFGFMF